MNISNDNIKKIAIEDFKTDNHVLLSSKLNTEDLNYVIKLILDAEAADPTLNIKICLDSFSSEQIVSMFKTIYSGNYLTVRNISIIQNTLNLLKTYNTFNDEFFKSDEIFVNSIEQFLDVKTDLIDILDKLALDILSTFISLCKTLPKTEYSLLDQYEDVPTFYVVVFNSLNMVTLCEILSNTPANVELETRKYKFTSPIIKRLCATYTVANSFMDKLVEQLTIVAATKESSGN